ncbi:hypothetical protein FE88_07790 [Azospirillum brasilense]|nr:hypothetical protein FE88_07790 [Azospirillum brasilense]
MGDSERDVTPLREAGSVENTRLVPEGKLTNALLLLDSRTVVRVRVSGDPAVQVPMPYSYWVPSIVSMQ